jgi:hypothetical protein
MKTGWTKEGSWHHLGSYYASIGANAMIPGAAAR